MLVPWLSINQPEGAWCDTTSEGLRQPIAPALEVLVPVPAIPLQMLSLAAHYSCAVIEHLSYSKSPAVRLQFKLHQACSLHSPFFGLRLKPAIQPGPLIRRLVPPRCSSARTKMIPLQNMLEHLLARLPLLTLLPLLPLAGHRFTNT